MPDSASVLPSQAKRDDSAVTGTLPVSRVPGRFVARREGPDESRAFGARVECQRQRGRGQGRGELRKIDVACVDVRAGEERGRERRDARLDGEVRVAQSALGFDRHPLERARDGQIGLAALEFAVALERERAGQRVRRCCGELCFAGQRAPVGHEAQLADRVHSLAAGIAEGDSGHVSLLLARLPVEALHADVAHVDLERQPEGGREAGRRLVRLLEFDRQALGAQALHDELARQQVERRPRERGLACFDVDVLALPCDARDAHGRQKRAFGAFDREMAFGLGDRASDDVVERGLAAERHVDSEEHHQQGDQEPGDDAQEDARPTPLTPRRWGGQGRIRAQNDSPTEKCTRTSFVSSPYATSSRNGPIGVRSRPPTP
jgi:hypothetical protein